MRTRIFYVNPQLFILAYRPDYEPHAADYKYVATIDAETPDDAFAKMNRGSGREVPELDQQRSLSVGDIVYIGDLYYLCQPTGWKALSSGPEMSALYGRAVHAEDRVAR